MSKRLFLGPTTRVDQGSSMGSSNIDPKSRMVFRRRPSKRVMLAERELSGKAERHGKITLPKIRGFE
jgi:hypothetical protein